MAQSTGKSVSSAILGYPRVGVNRELKRATEAFWKGNLPQEQLLQTAAELRRTHWQLQRDSGVDVIPSNDFSLYDQVLDMSALLGAVPPRYGWNGETVDLDMYFAMARGVLEKQDLAGEKTIPAMEMTKWFDTNYHYIVPEFHRDATFRVSSTKVFDEFKEAQALGLTTRPVLVGPVSYLLLGKSKEAGFDALDLLERLLPVYADVLKQLHSLGATSVQLDEPYLVMDLQDKAKEAFRFAYRTLASSLSSMKLDLVVATYFGALDDNLELAASLPVAGLHVDLVRGAEQLQAVDRALPSDKLLSLGVVDGRNIWKADLTGIVTRLDPVLRQSARSRFHVAPSCSLLHTPFDLDLETVLDDEIKSWMSYAKQKLGEVVLLTRVLSRQGAAAELEANAACIRSRNTSARIHCAKVQERVAAVKPADMQRKSSFTERQQLQHARLNLPLFPTTTIGSFPQTSDVRVHRAAFRKGEMAADAYNDFIKSKIASVIQWQEELDLDVLVHGEFERTDMVEYFGEQLRGFTFTKNGWVQSYGTRCVKPPVIYGDVSRPLPMTVEWAKYAQSCTSRPVKGMLTGPITILQWSFVRDDQPRSVTAQQIALAIRDEVLDLEANGIAVIQIDEAALREGLPLRRAAWKAYLDWAVAAFKLSACGVSDKTQIHTHMCYSEFNDIIQAIADLDADVISIETSRSQMELLDAFTRFRYPNEIGPGVYDIHSPRIPSTAEMEDLMKKAAAVLSARNIWVNPDCGLKTRGWKETETALRHMVQVAHNFRAQHAVAC